MTLPITILDTVFKRILPVLDLFYSFLVLHFFESTPDISVEELGIWSSWKLCPAESYIINLQTYLPSNKIHAPLNGIRFKCNDLKQTEIVSGHMESGKWYDESEFCNNGFYGGLIFKEPQRVSRYTSFESHNVSFVLWRDAIMSFLHNNVMFKQRL